jgi:hypothetical protein
MAVSGLGDLGFIKKDPERFYRRVWLGRKKN